MILRWIYFLLSRKELLIFNHMDIYFSLPSLSTIERIQSLSVTNQIALSPNNLTILDNGVFDFSKVVVFLNCESSITLLALERFLMSANVPTLFFIKWNDSLPEISIKNYFDSLEKQTVYKFTITNQLYILSNSSIYEMYYDINQKAIVKKFQMGNTVESYLSSRKNFQMAKIIAAHAKDWEGVSSSGENTIKSGGKASLTYPFFGYMQDFLNFTVEFRSSKDWDSMANKVLLKKADIGVSASIMTPFTSENFKFLMPPTYIDQATIHYIMAEQESSTVLVHITSFQPKVWLVIFAVLMIIITSYSIISWPLNLSKPVWLILCCFCQQSCPTEKSNSSRILTFTCSLFCVIIYALYSGSLISSMSTQTNSFSSIEQLIDNGYRFGIQNDSYSNTLAAIKHGNSIGGKILSNLHSSKEFQYPSSKLGIQTVLSMEKYAIITEMSHSDIVNEFQYQKENLQQRCWPMAQLPIPYYTVQHSCTTKKDSPLASYFNLARMTMKERGIADSLLRRRSDYIREQKANCKKLLEGERPFTLRDVAVPFTVMVFGLIFSFIILAIELIYKARRTYFIFHGKSQ